MVWKTAHKVICGLPRSGGSWWPRSLALFHAHRCNALVLVSTVWGVLVPKTLTGLWCPSKTPGRTQQPAAPALTGGHHTWWNPGTLTPPPPACPLFSSGTLVSSWHAISESQRTNTLLRFSKCPQGSPGQVRTEVPPPDCRLHEGWDHVCQTFC